MSEANDPMLSSSAAVSTPLASRYLQQLCKHFGHRLEVEFTPEAGRIAFPGGECLLAASGETLAMTVRAAGAEELARLQGVVASHLERFAFREPPSIEWSAAAA